MLNHLVGFTWSDIQYDVHSYARLSANPKQEHGEAIEYIIRYLKGTQDIGMILHHSNKNVFKVYADADFWKN